MRIAWPLVLGSAPVILAHVQYLGVTIAGGEFGCDIEGFCDTTATQLPLDNGPTQMQHFVETDGMNIMRLPISWQYLVDNQLGGDLNKDNVGNYDSLVQTCLDTGSRCIIDLHNFGKWNGKVVGQGGPSDEDFSSLWRQLANNYAANDNVVFQLMNAPHDVEVERWAETCQHAVTAIREAGAENQMILLPGANWDSAATLVSDGSADALMAITNPDGSTDNLVLDIHKYLDADNSGTTSKCTTNNIEAFSSVAKFLRKRGRKGLVSETGATKDSSCYTAFCEQNEFINDNSDVFLGIVMWAAGSLDPATALSVTPTEQNGNMVDNNLMMQCFIGPWVAESMNTMPSPSSASSSASSATKASSTASSPIPTTLITAPSFTTTKTPSTTSAPTRISTTTNLIASQIETEGTVVVSMSSAGPMTTLLVAPGAPTEEPGPPDGSDLIAPTTTEAPETTIPLAGSAAPTTSNSAESSSVPDSAAAGYCSARSSGWLAGSAAALVMLVCF